MYNVNGCNFTWIYQCYLDWFSSHARPGAAPMPEEELAGVQAYNEDVFDNGSIVLSRVVYYVPLAPSEAKSGRPELFGFTELNLLQGNGEGDIRDIAPVEYALLQA